MSEMTRNRVLIVDEYAPDKHRDRWIYTAITRASAAVRIRPAHRDYERAELYAEDRRLRENRLKLLNRIRAATRSVEKIAQPFRDRRKIRLTLAALGSSGAPGSSNGTPPGAYPITLS